MTTTKPMLAKSQEDLPRGEGWRYEPKWDGFRAIVTRDADGVRIDSRGDRPLGRYFPELVELLAGQPPAWVGEAYHVLEPEALDLEPAEDEPTSP